MTPIAYAIIAFFAVAIIMTVCIWRRKPEVAHISPAVDRGTERLVSKREAVYGKPYVPPAHPKTRPMRTVDRHERVGSTSFRSARNDDDMLSNPLHPLSPLNPIHSSWSPAYSNDESCHRHSDSGSSYSSSDSGSSSSYDSGSSSSSDSSSSSSSCD